MAVNGAKRTYDRLRRARALADIYGRLSGIRAAELETAVARKTAAFRERLEARALPLKLSAEGTDSVKAQLLEIKREKLLQREELKIRAAQQSHIRKAAASAKRGIQLPELDRTKLSEIARLRIDAALEKYSARLGLTTKRTERAEELYRRELESIDLATERRRAELDEKSEQYLVRLRQRNAQKLSAIESRIERLTKASESLASNGGVMAADTLLKVDGLCMHFGGLKAVENLSFEVKQGEIFGLIGPNGAGKTTVFNCITQFYRPTKGLIWFRMSEESAVRTSDYYVHDICTLGIVRTFQNIELVPELSVLENLLVAAHRRYNASFFGRMFHLGILRAEESVMRAKAEEVLAFLGLSQYAPLPAYGLPYGILKKIEIARTLMAEPKLIILDEPAAGLNESETRELARLIREIRTRYGCTILLVEHDMGLVMNLCDRICAISFGQKLAVGSAAEIQANKQVQTAYLGTEED